MKTTIPSGKQWICTFPGCTESSPKTHYNCYSHVWDAHLRHIISFQTIGFKKAPSYKKLPDRKAVRKLCENYMQKLNKSQSYDFNSPNPLTNSNCLLLDTKTPLNNCLFDSEELIVTDKQLTTQTLNIQNSSSFSPLVQQFDWNINQNSEYNTLPSIPFIQIEILQNALKRLHVAGEILAENGFLQRSDSKLKTSIEPLTNSLQKLLKLVGVQYNYKEDNTVKYGFIAQEVNKTCPELAPNGTSLDVVGILPIIIESLKEINLYINDTSEIKQQVTITLEYIDSIKKCIENTEEKQQPITQSHKFHFSVGPAVLTAPLAVGTTAISIWTIFALPKLPGIWVLLFITSACLWVSFWRTRNEIHKNIKNVKLYWTTNNTACLWCLLFLTLLSVSVSLVMGVVGVIICGCGIIVVGLVIGIARWAPKKYGCTLEIVLTILVAFMVLFFLIIGGMLLAQPGFECYLNGNHSEMTILLKQNITMEQLGVNKLPWNCWSDNLLVYGTLPTGISIGHDETPYIYGKVEIPFEDTKVDIYVKCVDAIKFYCSTVNFKYEA
ncbi:hypothetical protein EHI8A_006510 [Entamoeba histolytica HM-1:IMSS-B]|uniref:Peptidase S74 domain-containing protein n=6 Tax=Entamoeba histolytica TaxID=5759 RepID=C4LSB3_ENTH1|nr:hypothetical protein EHI_153210 [Entamoeba histolytica HM-1:IMSS]EMD45275.1 Hypothetical protein EHI5A_018720 [Entamoeba histolytica KU27]EMH74413.1 hypothetical protein EHI8A_006510 [Entamoeba histolytica HM-1:IMSS-B]EMS17372.1 hypothetical protein KM1_019350 [Entamoeba histolytica HM-3:IMSS]ENY63983.1 hypothetical protein EHI7A_007280 [Entamoeba histolytica HM-1:IMSS-A]GAT91575.1 hypothetical protein CL6EHI_153210 [Entamoeba histolytica]|eukprot:XP_656394.1 hypothetical protein EHI_153210 [Entamoeba histolytica HM-1:IMSS]